MKESTQPIPVYYLGHLVDSLASHSFPINAWLHNQGIQIERLVEPDTKISANQLDKLMSEALKLKGLEALGLDIGSRLQIAHHGTFGLALLNCENFSHILEFVRRYLVIRIPFIELTILEEDDRIVVLAKDTHWEGNLHRFVIEAVSGAFFNIFLALKQKIPELALESILFDYSAPNYVSKYDRFKGVNLQFDQAYCGITFNKSLLKIAIPYVDKLSFLQAQQACQQELDKLMQFSTYKGKVQQCLMQFQNKRPTLQEVADNLNVSNRSLHRYLTNEQTSFKLLLDEHQARLAKQFLVTHGYTVSQTAASLGFIDIANFRRAFKRWYQCTPTEFLEKAKKN